MIWRRLYIPAQLGAILLAGGLAGFASLILGGALGGVAMGVAPEPTGAIDSADVLGDPGRRGLEKRVGGIGPVPGFTRGAPADAPW